MADNSLNTRRLTFDDAERCAAIINDVAADNGMRDILHADTLLLEWQEPGFDLPTSSIGILDGDALIAFAVFWATGDTPVHPRLDWQVHPAHRDSRYAPFLLRWADGRIGEVISRCPPEARITLRCSAYKGHRYAEDALLRGGYRFVRAFYDMEINMTERPQAPTYPAGIVTRPYEYPADLPTLVDVIRDAFSDHYGHMERPFERDLELFRHWLDNDARCDPSLMIFAVDKASGQVVGCLMGLTRDFRDPEAGYIDTVGVRRAYRKRGVATAMLRHSLGMFWDRDTKTVHLEVDGDSLTNAVALYERAGLHVYRQHLDHEKLMRDGVELAKVALD